MLVKSKNSILVIYCILTCWIYPGIHVNAQNWEDVSVIMFPDSKLEWTTHNFGRLMGYPAWDPFYWPVNTHHYKSQHCIMGSFIFAVEDNVIESYSEETSPDWMPMEHSRGLIHASDQPDALYINAIYPQMASSVEPLTWPRRSASDPSVFDPNGENWWPGRMRPGSVEDDRWKKSAPFAAADKEAFCVFSDQYNVGAPPLGIQVAEQIYTYTRDYATDMAFIDFIVINTSNVSITGAYIGYHLYPYIPGGGIHDDYLVAYDSDFDGDEKPDVFYAYDPVDDKLFSADTDSDWPNHRFGLFVLNTPLTQRNENGNIEEMGVTDFHFFDAPGPVTNESQWPVICSDTLDTDLAGPVDFYFHDAGADNRIDNTDWIPENRPKGFELAFCVMCGPIDLAPGDSIRFTIGFTAAENDENFRETVRQAQLLAAKDFTGPGAPPAPALTAVPGDGKISLYWDDSAEHTPDAFTGEIDFEGYKIYRLAKGPFGTDDWGREITNSDGEIVGYVPMAQFDKIDGITGLDPVNPLQNLGNETGLKHSYIDSTVVNGVEYTYCITVYDKGDTTGTSWLPSFESGRSIASTSRFVVAAMAGTPALGVVAGSTSDDILYFSPSDTSFFAEVEIINSAAVTGHDYELSFSDFTSILDTMIYQQGFNLYNITDKKYVIQNGALTDSTVGGDNTPIADGMRINFTGRPSGDVERLWLSPSNTTDGAILPFWYAKRFQVVDLEFTIDVENPAALPSFQNYGDLTFQVPIRVTNIKTGEDLTPYMRIADEAWKHPNDSRYNSINYPAGSWDLNPGGACWNPILDSLMTVQPFDRFIESSDRIYGYDSSGRIVLFKLYTVHPPDATDPSDGDKFYFGDQKSFTRDAKIQFSTTKSHSDQSKITSAALEAIRVVPNPYIVSASWDIHINMGKVMFTHLPEICDIQIFTVAGDLIKTIEHRGIRSAGNIIPGSTRAEELTRAGQGYEEWDLTTDDQLGIAFGLYVYVVTTPNGAKKVGKLAVIK